MLNQNFKKAIHKYNKTKVVSLTKFLKNKINKEKTKQHNKTIKQI